MGKKADESELVKVTWSGVHTLDIDLTPHLEILTHHLKACKLNLCNCNYLNLNSRFRMKANGVHRGITVKERTTPDRRQQVEFKVIPDGDNGNCLGFFLSLRKFQKEEHQSIIARLIEQAKATNAFFFPNRYARPTKEHQNMNDNQPLEPVSAAEITPSSENVSSLRR